MKLKVPSKYIPEKNKTMVYIQSEKEYCIINKDGIVYALDNLCPHQGASLALGEVNGEEIVCPLHQFRFNFKNGNCNIERFKTNTYSVEIIENN